MRRCRFGITLLETLAAVIVTLIFLVLLVPLVRSRPHRGSFLTCEVQIKQISQAWKLWSQDYRNELPNPMRISAATAAKTTEPFGSTAALHSLLIFNNYYSPELTICPGEANRNVHEKSDYDYGQGPNSKLSMSEAWDFSFSGNLNKRSNVSYANAATLDSAAQREWADTLNPSEMMLIGDRGPKDGLSNPGSLSYRLHGTKTTWVGNIARMDLSVAKYEEKVGTSEPFAFAPGDNVFAPKKTTSGDVQTLTDNYLAIFGDTSKDPVETFWD